MVIPRLTCRVGATTIRAELARGSRIRWAAEAAWSDHASLVEAVAELAGQAALPAWGRNVRFVLGPELIQTRMLADLPPVGRSQLAAMVALAPHRYFRRNGVLLVTDAAWVGRHPRRSAMVAAADVPLVQALVRGAREAGLGVEGIEAAVAVSGRPLSLLPPDERVRRDARRARWTRHTLIAAAAAWLLLGGGVLSGRIVERRRIDARSAEVAAPVAAVLAAEARADSVARMVRRLEWEAGREGEIPTVLYRVALALPDSAFLTQLRVDSTGVGLVAGAARRPAAVLAAFEGKAGLVAPRFAGRSVRDLVSGRPVERFAIGFGTPEGTP